MQGWHIPRLHSVLDDVLDAILALLVRVELVPDAFKELSFVRYCYVDHLIRIQ